MAARVISESLDPHGQLPLNTVLRDHKIMEVGCGNDEV